MATDRPEIDAAHLLAARDELAVVRDLVVCLCLACSSPILPRNERTALSQLALLVRERLEFLIGSLDELASPRPSPLTSPAGDRA